MGKIFYSIEVALKEGITFDNAEAIGKEVTEALKDQPDIISVEILKKTEYVK